MSTNSNKKVLVVLLGSLFLPLAALAKPQGQDATDPSNPQSEAGALPLSSQELQQLVAPIALYPDALVAQILAASTYPTQIVEEDRWMKRHSSFNRVELAQEVDQQPWDPSVKALTQFPSVLDMDKNLSWTSSLGDAYANQPQDVTDNVQTLRQQAQKAGHLNSNDQEKVTTEGNTIVVEPTGPDVVYVPAYDPWLVYGAPMVAYPGWYPVPGIFFAGPTVTFGAGFGVGFFRGFGWGWRHRGADWHGHRLIYNHTTYVSHSRTIINHNHNNFNHANFGHGNVSRGNFNRGNMTHGDTSHGPSDFHSGTRSGAFSGFDHGGTTRGLSSRGRASFSGGFHAGGGGRHR